MPLQTPEDQHPHQVTEPNFCLHRVDETTLLQSTHDYLPSLDHFLRSVVLPELLTRAIKDGETEKGTMLLSL